MLIGGFIRGLETILEPDQVEIVKKELLDSANKLDRGDFQNLNVAPSAFGSSDAGSELGFHHGRAQQVIADTLAGVTADMRDFREGVVKAEVMLEDADTGAQSDLSRREQAVAQLDDANRWFAGDQRYHQARNEHGGGEG
jgi:hypothetical protein